MSAAKSTGMILIAAVSALLLVCVFSKSAPVRAGEQQPAAAGGGSASVCGQLSLPVVEKIVGERFHDPDEGKAPPAYHGAWGTTCEFSRMEPFPQGQDTRVDLTIYTEASAAEAKQTFDQAAVYFADKSKPNPGIGDESYWQSGDKEEPRIHVLKGKTHFDLGMMRPADEKKLLSLAAAVAAQH